jgi:hypothetical protein
MVMNNHKTKRVMESMHSISNGFSVSTKNLTREFISLRPIQEMRFSIVPHIQVLFMIITTKSKNFYKVIAIRLQQPPAQRIRDGL